MTARERAQRREARLESIRVLATFREVNLPDLAAQFQLSESYTWGLLQTLLRRRVITRAGTRKSTRGRAATTFRAATPKTDETTVTPAPLEAV